MIVTNLNPPEYATRRGCKPMPPLGNPKRIGCFSLDAKKNFVEPLKNLLYLRLRPPGTFDYDLNHGYESWIAKPHISDINTKLKFIMQNPEKFLDETGKRLNSDFFPNRGILTRMFKSPYDRDSWDMLAMKFKGTIFLLRNGNHQGGGIASRSTYYGHNFERFVATDNAYSRAPPNPPNGPMETTPFYLALTTKLNGFRLLLTGEVDGIDNEEEKDCLEEMNFIELKTRMEPRQSDQSWKLLKNKFPGWWCQSFLMGIDTIYCGVRTNDGHVKRVEKYAVKDIPGMSKQHWCPDVMLNFGADLLAFVNDAMDELDCAETVYNFKYNRAVNANVTYEIFSGKNQLSFLPQAYVDFMNNL